ncbi:TetR/AcrR family transcriptional regulator [Agrococcus sp. Marseille-P2731]|uniref:TetR/AcrR family transcriptional regulator n=1 Tax=Agrococcus sp. Marseille-P2731 TaxID=1841862 RepID=UPI00092FE29C|nr:TetR/AcrR family transcriptional regulator [Agrococcus sp. Marseille-P2731]
MSAIAQPTDEPQLGLRERKKQLTHRTIADAAYSLAAEHGLDIITIDQIAERAFVSPRTVSNYFVSKEAAVVAAHDNSPAEFVAGIAERPADEPPLQTLRAVLSEAMREWSPERLQLLREKEELIRRYPVLLPHRMSQFDELEDAIREAIALRSGEDPESAAYPRLLAGAAVAAVKTAIHIWDTTEGDAGTIPELIDAAFAELSHGLTHEA